MYHNHSNVGPTMFRVFKPVIDELLNEIENPKTTTSKNVLANIVESETTYEIQLSVSGHTKETVKIKIEDNVLKVEGTAQQADVNFKLKEFGVRSFTRSFNLPKNIDKNQIQARFENGILLVTIAKSALVSTKVEII
jgi:HSP20 family protein